MIAFQVAAAAVVTCVLVASQPARSAPVLNSDAVGRAWLLRQASIARVAIRAGRTLNTGELEARQYEPSQLLGAVEGLPSEARVYCAQAMQALANYTSGLLSAKPEQLRLSSYDLKMYREWLPRCEARVRKR